MMIKSLPFCVEIFPYRHIQDSDRLRSVTREILQSQDQIVRSISRLGSNLTVSLRYFYDPNQSPPLKTYLLINQAADSQTEENSEQISSLLTKGKLSEFFTLTPQAEFGNLQKLDWVQFLGEVLKREEFIEPQNYYLTHFFEANSANDMSAVCDVFKRLDGRLILEITLQTYHGSDEKPLWANAITQILAQLDKVNSGASGSKDNLLSATLALYQKYEQLYPTGDLFQYSIKALAENRGDASVVLDTLLAHATKETPHGKPCKILIVSRGNPGFSESLQATEKVDISTAIEWEGWQRNFGQLLIRDAIKPQKTGLAKFSDGSMSLSNLSSAPRLPSSAENPNQPRENDIVLSESSALAKFLSSRPPARIADLKPLHRLATAQEISGFFRIAIPRVAPAVSSEESAQKIAEEFAKGFTIEDVIRKYRHLISENTYVVGIDQNGNPCVSDFSKIPHRIVAGVPGSGKTNFITSVIYQFLLANPHRKIYIADFQAGMHYQLIVDQQPNLEMVTELEDCAKLLSELWNEHEARRQLMREKRVRSLSNLKENHGIETHRSLLIIDEAFYIQNAERKTRESIEKNLMALAAQARVTGIHIMYCSQRPTPEVIPSQISDNMDDRVIFRVQAGASQRLLDDDIAASLPVEPRGRAVYRGVEPEFKIVATPYVPDEIWERPLC